MLITRRGLTALAGAAVLTATPALAKPAPRVLVFHKATGYVHPSIETGLVMMRDIGARRGYDVVATDDPEVFADDTLSGFNAIVFLCSTTDAQHESSEWLVGERRTALQNFVHAGGGVVAIHAAADSHHHWPWYGQMIGGYFDRHPANPNVRPGVVRVVDHNHPATRGLPDVLERSDEWYLFRDFNPLVRLLLVADVSSVYDAGSDPLDMQWFTSQTNTNTRLRMPEANPKPIAWCHEFEGARVFYTEMGHVPETFSEPLVVQHIEGGLRWALGANR